MQKYVVIVVVIILLGAGAAAPYWFGMQAEQAYKRSLEEVTKDGQVAITNPSYERGWLDSTAEATYTVSGTPISLTATHKIYHGPIPFDGEMEFKPVLALIVSQANLNLPAPLKVPPLTGKTIIHLEGDSETHIAMAGGSSTEAAGSSITWQGLSGDSTTSADMKQMTLKVILPLLQVNSATQKFSLAQAKIDANLHEGVSGLTTGSLAYSIDKLSGVTETDTMAINGLVLAMSSSEAAGNLNADIDLKIQSFSNTTSNYGPGQVNIKIRNLDAATLVKYQNEMRALQAKKLPAEQMPSMFMGKMLALLTSLSKKAPEMEISKLSLKMPDGEITGHGKLVLDGSKTDISENPGLLLMALSGEGVLLVPKSAVRMLTELDLNRQVESLKAQGKLSEKEIKKLTPQKVSEISSNAAPKYMDRYAANMKLVPDGENYKAEFSLSQGQLLVNGQPTSGPVRLP